MKTRWNHAVGRWRSALIGACLCLVVGLGLLRWGRELGFLGYDLLFAFRTTRAPDEVVIVYMDDRSYGELQQDSTAAWDRNLHAKLVDRMTEADAKLVVFDVLWNLPGSESANSNLVRAVEDNGRVVLAAALESITRPQIQAKRPVLPLAEFVDAAAGWGITEMMSPTKATARQYFVGSSTQPSLPWRAAQLAGADIATSPDATQPDRWLNYYGPALTLHSISYCDVPEEPLGRFRNKFVFVGARPETLTPGDQADAFRTPHTLWTRELTPGVEITATAFANLMRNDGLRMMSRTKQIWLVSILGLIVGATVGSLRPGWAIGLACATGIALLGLAVRAAGHHVWFPWTVVAFGQIPVALAWSVRGHFHRLGFEKAVLERTLAETSKVSEAAKGMPRDEASTIPDHELIRCVGKGAYGEVWLARSVIAVSHAVKIVRRSAFPEDAPYEREFKGIQKFMPISRSHPGFVNVLHVGRDDAQGFFFYIMEVADDQSKGQDFDAETYSPKTLASELNRRGKLPPEECCQLGIALAGTLEHLHQKQLVHRDIKPGNIIYVNGAPKFADIGLVTEQRGDSHDMSLVGTEGYVPPEGPGAPSADVYALGKVLYEASMGRDRQLFPEVPTAVWEEPETGLLRRLNMVIGRACETDVHKRFTSAAELHAALVELQGQ